MAESLNPVRANPRGPSDSPDSWPEVQWPLFSLLSLTEQPRMADGWRALASSYRPVQCQWPGFIQEWLRQGQLSWEFTLCIPQEWLVHVGGQPQGGWVHTRARHSDASLQYGRSRRYGDSFRPARGSNTLQHPTSIQIRSDLRETLTILLSFCCWLCTSVWIWCAHLFADVHRIHIICCQSVQDDSGFVWFRCHAGLQPSTLGWEATTHLRYCKRGVLFHVEDKWESVRFDQVRQCR